MQNSPFATPGLSIIKTMTMAVGEMDFETIFRLSSGGVKSVVELPMPIPYPGVSILLWIFFLIAMPILLMNLLVRRTRLLQSFHKNCVLSTIFFIDQSGCG